MTPPRHAWREREFPTKTKTGRSRRTFGLRALYSKALDRFFAVWHAAEAAEARRAARHAEANEPWFASASAERRSKFETGAAPAFVPSPQFLSADRFAPSQHPEIEPFEVPLAGHAAARTDHHNDERCTPAGQEQAIR